MAIHLTIDESLVEEARAIGDHPTNLEAVIAALQEYIMRYKQLRIINLFGTIEYEPDYDYKEQQTYGCNPLGTNVVG
jgi:hypothetical protein